MLDIELLVIRPRVVRIRGHSDHFNLVHQTAYPHERNLGSTRPGASLTRLYDVLILLGSGWIRRRISDSVCPGSERDVVALQQMI